MMLPLGELGAIERGARILKWSMAFLVAPSYGPLYLWVRTGWSSQYGQSGREELLRVEALRPTLALQMKRVLELRGVRNAETYTSTSSASGVPTGYTDAWLEDPEKLPEPS